MKLLILILFAVMGCTAYLNAETFPFDSKLTGWSKAGTRNAYPDSRIKHSEIGSVRLESGATVYRSLELEPDTDYEILFAVKGEKLESGNNLGSRIVLGSDSHHRYTHIGTKPDNSPETGTFDWKKGRVHFNTSRFKTGKIQLAIRVNGNGTAWYDSIEIKKIAKSDLYFRTAFDNQLKDVAFYPLGNAGFFDPGQPVSLKLEADGSGKAAYSVRFKDYDGRPVAAPLSGTFDLPGSAELKLSYLPDGYYVAEAELSVNNKKSYYIQSGFVVTPPFGKRDPFFQLGNGVYSSLHDAYKRVGVGSISCKFNWAVHYQAEQSAEKQVQWQLNLFRPFLKSDDFDLSICINATIPNRLRDPADYAAGKPLLNDFLVNRLEKCLLLLVPATSEKCKVWTVQVEIPSTATLKKYAGTWTEAMFNQLTVSRMSSRIIRKIDPSAEIWVGGNNVKEYLSSIDAIVMKDLIQDFDGYVIDAYTGNFDMRIGGYAIPETNLMSFYREASALAKSLGKYPEIKNEELGYAMNFGAAFDKEMARTQADLTARTIIITRAAPVKKFELHLPTYHDPAWSENDTSYCMTTIWKPILLRDSFKEVPLPGGAAYVTAAHQLSFAKLHSEIINENCYAYLFIRPDGSTVAAIWNFEKNHPISLKLQSPANRVSVIGQTEPLSQGVHKLNLSPSPFYIVTREDADQLEKSIRQSFSNALPCAYVAAKIENPKETRVYIRSAMQESVTGELHNGKGLVRKVVLPPGKIVSVVIPKQEKISLHIGDKVLPVPEDSEFITAVRVAEKPVFDGSGKWLRNLKPYYLRYPENVYPKKATQHELGYFKSPFNPNGHNYAADYYAAYDKEYFYFAVLTDDPNHFPNDLKRLHHGDNVQWVISIEDVPPKAVRPQDMPESVFSHTLDCSMALTKNGPVLRKNTGTASVSGILCHISRKENKTLYEIAAPWKTLLFHPSSGKAFRFNMSAVDKTSLPQKWAPYRLSIEEGVGIDAAVCRLVVFK